MSLMGNIATRLGFAPTLGGPKATPVEAPQGLPPRPQRDAFIRQSPVAAAPVAPKPLAPKGLPARPVAPAAPSFGDLVASEPAKVWAPNLTPRMEAALAAYRAGKLGESVRELDLRRKSVQECREALVAKGFTVEHGHITDVRTGKPAVHPETGEAIPMEIWTHPDGGMVRIKPEGDPTSKFRPQAHLSKSVKYPPDASGHDFNNEAFKVDAEGRPLPKWPKDANPTAGVDTPAGKKFLDDLANATHLNLV